MKENNCVASSRSNTLELRNLLRHSGNQPINASQPPIVGLFIEIGEGRVSKTSAAKPWWVVPLGMINESINSQEFDKTRLKLPSGGLRTQTHFLVVAALHLGGREATTGTGNGSVQFITYLQSSDNKNTKERKGKKRAQRVEITYIQEILSWYILDGIFSLKLH